MGREGERAAPVLQTVVIGQTGSTSSTLVFNTIDNTISPFWAGCSGSGLALYRRRRSLCLSKTRAVWEACGSRNVSQSSHQPKSESQHLWNRPRPMEAVMMLPASSVDTRCRATNHRRRMPAAGRDRMSASRLSKTPPRRFASPSRHHSHSVFFRPRASALHHLADPCADTSRP